MPLGAPPGIVNSTVTASGSVIFSQALLIKTAGGLMKMKKKNKNCSCKLPSILHVSKKNQGGALNSYCWEGAVQWSDALCSWLTLLFCCCSFPCSKALGIKLHVCCQANINCVGTFLLLGEQGLPSLGSPKSPVLPSGGPAGQEELGRSQPAPVCVADPPLPKCMGKHKLRYGSGGGEALRNDGRKICVEEDGLIVKELQS